MNTRRVLLLPVLACALILGGCATVSSTPTPPAPTPPQVTAANAIGSLAATIGVLQDSIVAARNAGKLSAAEVRTIEDFERAAAVWGKSADAEIRSADTWAVQRGKIAQSAAVVGLAALKSHVSATSQALISSLVAVVNQILAAVGESSI